MQGAVIRSAQQDGQDVASSGPVQYLLSYAASLGITKDITKTTAYSVYLQGVTPPLHGLLLDLMPIVPLAGPMSVPMRMQPWWTCMVHDAGAIVLVILAAIDAAFSGDWSRTGVISKDVELGLRPLLGLLGLFHIFCGTIAAVAASRKGYNPVPATAKVMPLGSERSTCLIARRCMMMMVLLLTRAVCAQVLAVGFLALVEVLLKDPAEGRRA